MSGVLGVWLGRSLTLMLCPEEATGGVASTPGSPICAWNPQAVDTWVWALQPHLGSTNCGQDLPGVLSPPTSMKEAPLQGPGQKSRVCPQLLLNPAPGSRSIQLQATSVQLPGQSPCRSPAAVPKRMAVSSTQRPLCRLGGVSSSADPGGPSAGILLFASWSSGSWPLPGSPGH